MRSKQVIGMLLLLQSIMQSCRIKFQSTILVRYNLLCYSNHPSQHHLPLRNHIKWYLWQYYQNEERLTIDFIYCHRRTLLCKVVILVDIIHLLPKYLLHNKHKRVFRNLHYSSCCMHYYRRIPKGFVSSIL
jgi:hypothetical protein